MKNDGWGDVGVGDLVVLDYGAEVLKVEGRHNDCG